MSTVTLPGGPSSLSLNGFAASQSFQILLVDGLVVVRLFGVVQASKESESSMPARDSSPRPWMMFETVSLLQPETWIVGSGLAQNTPSASHPTQSHTYSPISYLPLLLIIPPSLCSLSLLSHLCRAANGRPRRLRRAAARLPRRRLRKGGASKTRVLYSCTQRTFLATIFAPLSNTEMRVETL